MHVNLIHKNKDMDLRYLRDRIPFSLQAPVSFCLSPYRTNFPAKGSEDSINLLPGQFSTFFRKKLDDHAYREVKSSECWGWL